MVVELPMELLLASVVNALDSEEAADAADEADPAAAWPFLLFPVALLLLPLPATPVGAAACSADPPASVFGMALLLLLISFDLYESR